MEPLGKEHDILKPYRSWGRGLHSVGFLLQASGFGFSFVVGLGFCGFGCAGLEEYFELDGGPVALVN